MSEYVYWCYILSLCFDYTLQFLASACLLYNKKLLSQASAAPAGWLWGIVGMILFYPYVIKYHLDIMKTYNSAFIIIQAYGYILTWEIAKHWNKILTKGLKIIFILFAFIVCCYIYSKKGTWNFGTLQFLQAITGLFASLFLTFDSPRLRMIGWYCMAASNIFCLSHVIGNNGWIIAFFQAWSIKYARTGILKERELKT